MALKHTGIEKNTHQLKTVELTLPLKDKGFGNLKGMHPDLQHITTMFSESVHNAMFAVEYTLEVWIKHKSKLEIGVGNSVEFPITVRGQAFELPFLQSRVQTWQEQENVPTWDPSQIAPTTYCSQVKDAQGNYKTICSHDPSEINANFKMDNFGARQQLQARYDAQHSRDAGDEARRI